MFSIIKRGQITHPVTNQTTPPIKGQSTKGQVSGTGAAVLVLLIFALIVVYILFLPPATRQELLQEEDLERGLAYGERELLVESPGRLDYVSQREIEHTLPAVNLFSSTNAVVLRALHSLYVKSAWLDESGANMSFSIDNLQYASDVMLSFNVRKHQGRLRILLNGNQVFDSEITTLNAPPIMLPKDLLQQKNELGFATSSVGAKFWGTNEYELSDLQVSGKVTDVSTQQSKTSFTVTSTERDNLDRVFVKFLSDCVQEQVGILDVAINDHNIFSGVPDCGVPRPLEIAGTYIIGGENVLSFKTQRGSYLIDNIVVKSKLRELTFPTYYFEITPEEVVALQRNAEAVLEIEFPDDIETKRADLFLNGHPISINTREKALAYLVSELVRDGTNVIQLKPRTTMDIVNLRVVLT